MGAMRIPTLKGAAALLLLAASCANPVQLKTAERYFESGIEVSERGNHYHGAALFSRAYGNAKMGKANDAGLSMTLYAYGRELALLGEFEEAIGLLEESIQVERKVAQSTSAPAEILRRTSVLGRVYLDTGRPAEALAPLQEAVEIVRAVGVDQVSPQDYMDLLQDLEQATAAAGSAAALEPLRAELTGLRNQQGDVEQDSPYERFTPEAVQLRLGADRSPSEFKPK